MSEKNYYLLFAINVLLFIAAPSCYSYEFCLLIFIVFLYTAILNYIKSKKYEIIGFNLLFTLSFAGVTFAFPLIVYPIDPNYSLMAFGYDHNVITKCTAICGIAYSSYVIGYQKLFHTGRPKRIEHTLKFGDYEANVVFCITLFLFVLSIVWGGLDGIESRYNGSQSLSNPNIKYVFVALMPMMQLMSVSLFFCNKKKNIIKILLLICVMCVSLFAVGSRAIPLVMLTVVLYWFVKRFNLSLLSTLSIVTIGVILLSIIGNLRSTQVSIEGIRTYSNQATIGWVENISDLFINSRNLYAAYSEIDTFWDYKPTILLGTILAVIPFLQSIVKTIFNIPYYLMSSPDYFTWAVFGVGSKLGLGTHIVGEVYLASGLIGVIFMFYILGKIVGFSMKRMADGEIKWSIVYLMLLSSSVFMCRGSIFEAFRPAVLGIITIYLINKFRISLK